MRAKTFFTISIVLLLFTSWFFSCSSGDDDDDDSDSASDDDTSDDDDDDAPDDDDADDDLNDDSDDDGPFSCDDLTDVEMNLFKKVFIAGASYSNPTFGSPPFGMEQTSDFYFAKAIERAWINLGQCVDYEPEFWIYWDDESDRITADTTISLAIDAFFWSLSFTSSEEVIRGNFSDYLDNIYGETGLEEGETFIGGNIPKMLMNMAGFFGDKDRVLEIMQEEIDKRPGARLIDFDYYMDALLGGRVFYDGVKIGFFDVIRLDFLHATEFGHQVIADIFIKELNDIYPHLKIEQFGSEEILEE
jgi:hypothetical protein